MADSPKLHELLSELDEKLRAMKQDVKTLGKHEALKSPAGGRDILDALANGVGEIQANMEKSRLERWKATAADNSDMLVSPESALAYLEHADPTVRIAAISVASQRWPANAMIALGCARLALDDRDNNVRSVAMVCLGTCYKDSGDEKISRLLAMIAANEQNGKDMRRSAYAGLLMVQGVDLIFHNPSFENPQDFPIPEGIDWGILSRFVD